MAFRGARDPEKVPTLWDRRGPGGGTADCRSDSPLDKSKLWLRSTQGEALGLTTGEGGRGTLGMLGARTRLLHTLSDPGLYPRSAKGLPGSSGSRGVV